MPGRRTARQWLPTTHCWLALDHDNTGLTEQLDSLVRCIPDDILAVDVEGRVTQYVPAGDRFLGYEAADLVGEPALEYVHPADRDTVLDTLRALATDDSTRVRFRLRNPEGDWLPVEASNSNPADGAVAAYVVTMREATEGDDAYLQLSSEREAGIDALHELYEIASATELSFETKRSRILDLGRRRLGLPYAFVSRITEDTQTIVASAGDHELLQSGESCPIEESYCRKTIHTEGLLALFDAAEAGFASDPAEEVFEGGYTTAREGTGFGLSIVEQIAEAHGWSVSLTESADGGARFEFLGTNPSAI